MRFGNCLNLYNTERLTLSFLVLSLSILTLSFLPGDSTIHVPLCEVGREAA